MRRLDNTLYLTNPDLYLGRDGQAIDVRLDGQRIKKLPIRNFENIVCFNYTGVSPGLLQLCGEENVTVTYLTPNGKYIGAFETEYRSSVITRKLQYEINCDEKKSLEYSKFFILGKLQNSIYVLERFLRDHREKDDGSVVRAIEIIEESKRKVLIARDKDELRGYEGDSSRAYFSVFDKLILAQKDEFKFEKRVRRPPTDNVNALLSLTYSFLRVKVEGGLQTAGLDPYMGFYHTERAGRTSLALDVMEELRPYIADRFVLSIINKNQIKGSDFYKKPNGAVELKETGFRKYIELWNEKLLEEVTHPYLEEKISKGLIPYSQGLLLSKNIRGELELYPPFIAI